MECGCSGSESGRLFQYLDVFSLIIYYHLWAIKEGDLAAGRVKSKPGTFKNPGGRGTHSTSTVGSGFCGLNVQLHICPAVLLRCSYHVNVPSGTVQSHFILQMHHRPQAARESTVTEITVVKRRTDTTQKHDRLK